MRSGSGLEMFKKFHNEKELLIVFREWLRDL